MDGREHHMFDRAALGHDPHECDVPANHLAVEHHAPSSSLASRSRWLAITSRSATFKAYALTVCTNITGELNVSRDKYRWISDSTSAGMRTPCLATRLFYSGETWKGRAVIS